MKFGFYKRKISYEIGLILLLLTTVPLSVVIGFNYFYSKQILSEEIVTNLSTIAEYKIEEIDFYINERKMDVQILSRTPVIGENIEILEKEYFRGGAASKGYLLREAKLRSFFNEYITNRNYYDIFLVSNSGEVIFSMTHENDFGTNLKTGPYRETELSRAFETASSKMGVAISDFRQYEPSSKPAAFISYPVIVREKLKGVLVLQINNDTLFSIINNYTGLGDTGEVITIVGNENEVEVMAPLRHRPESLFLKMNSRDYPEAVIFKAVKEEKGIRESIDYRGKSVIAAWRYIPSLRWSMVVKMDQDEIYRAVVAQKRVSFILLGFSLIMVIIFGFLSTRYISMPLLSLAEVAKKFSQGNLDARAKIKNKNEIGFLARKFNEMANSLSMNFEQIREQTYNLEYQKQEISRLNEELQQKVLRQTEELRKSRDQLDAMFFNSTALIYLKDINGNYILINRPYEILFGIKADGVAGKTDYDIHSEHTAEMIRKNDEAVIKNRTPMRFEEQISTGAKVFDYLSLKFPLFDSDGSIYAVCSMSSDITEQNKLLGELQRERDFSAAIVDNAGSLIVILDNTGKIMKLNNSGQAITGYRESEVLNKNVWDIFVPVDERESVIQVFSSLTAGNFPNTHENHWLTKTGDKVILSWANACLTDARGRVTHVIAIGNDITERKRLEKELLKYMANLDKAQQIAHMGSWDLDLENNHLWWSDEIYRIFGLAPQEFVANYDAFLNYVHPEDRALVADEVNKSLAGETKYNIYHRVLRPDGVVRIVHEEADLIKNEAGKPVRMVGMVQDVTELKNAQEELENANEKLNEYVRIIDQNVLTSSTDLAGVITNASHAFCEISGYEEAELIGKNHNIVRHPDVPSEIYRDLWETIRSGKCWRGEVKNRKKDGGEYWIEMNVSPTFDNAKKVIGYTAIRQDITDKKRIEEISITDALTNLFNRRYFNQIFTKELNRAKRENVNLAFILFDVDYFKKYNDHYGHQKGDEVLQKIGGLLKKYIRRASDYAFRIGGEEFGILLYNIEKKGAMDYAEGLRSSIEGLNIEHEKNSASRYVTISGGITIVSPEANLSEDEIFKNSDDLLYQAKGSGRNCIR